MSNCCEPSGDDRTPAGRRAGYVAIAVVALLGWGALAAVLIFG
jgi:hypothetical protein